MSTNVVMPQLGESVVEGTVGRWLVKEGDQVGKDQPIVEILTDKADTEVPSPVSGVVAKLVAKEDDVVAVGGVICVIEEGATATAGAAAPSASASAGTAAEVATASPSVRKLAREEGVNLSGVAGSGPGGRISQDDVRAAAPSPAGVRVAVSAPSEAHRSATPPKAAIAAPQATSTGLGAFKLPPYTPANGDEIIPFTRRRRIIADHMVYSKHTSPEVVTFAECDVQKTHLLREKYKNAYKKDGVSLTFLAFTIAATARALREFPEINARVLDDAYVKLANVNVGIAVDTPEGLVVPVIRDADQLTIRGIAKAIDDVAVRARDGQLTPNDLASKTFTVTNPGRKGNLVGGAIISQPNVGILRLGTIKKRVVVIEHEDEDLMAIHPVMHMALTYDHRIVDGVHANGFLYRISELLELADFSL